MTDTEPAADEPTTPDAETPDSDPSEPAEPADDNEVSPNSEAARWRTKLREAEAQRDALSERVSGYQRRECESVVADLLDEPGDLWDIGRADIAAFYNDDGELDEGELRAAAGALCELRPKLAKPRGPRWQNFGQGSEPPPAAPIGWTSVLKS